MSALALPLSSSPIARHSSLRRSRVSPSRRSSSRVFLDRARASTSPSFQELKRSGMGWDLVHRLTTNPWNAIKRGVRDYFVIDR
jgi:hypothetical protein